MTINQVVSAVSDIVKAAREAAAAAASRTYGAEREYAIALNGALPEGWYKVEHKDTGAVAELVHAEKKLYFKALHDKHPTGKYPNTSVPWGRVRKYAQEEVEGVTESANEGGGGAGEGEGDDDVSARHTRSLTLRYVQELTLLFNAGRRAEKEGMIQPREAEALTHIGAALQAMGVDLASLSA
jgi:hypothetical protein